MLNARKRLVIGRYVVDFDERTDCTYYSISQNGSNEILSMGQEPTYAEAEATARWTVRRLDPEAALEQDKSQRTA